jgi:purine-nucleoside phosphorylase
VPLADLGGFARTTVPGHAGAVRSVRIGPLRALVFLGRTHLYEGHPVATVVHGVRMAVAAGCRVVVLTNASGGIRESYRVGQPVLINDHLNLTGRSPLTGDPPPDGYPSRFTDLTDLYSRRLRELALDADPGLPEGVYAALPGPHYETPAEIRALRTLGADLVGMSTVLEAIAARHLGAEVLAISLVTNLAAGLARVDQVQPGGTPAGLDHAEVVAAGQAAAARVGALLAAILPRVLPGTG